MDETLFRKGKLFKEYVESSDFEKVYKNASISVGDEKFFSSLTLKVLCISEHWCGDCKREVPLLAYIAHKAGWDFRIFGRDENPALLEKYTTEGKSVIPVFVFFDENFKERGRFVEKAPEGKTTLEVLKEILGKDISSKI
ncbi:MAG: thioredoxin family protein [Theionarchaea archaeon]|nr:thioredoxin family protein [Theionarchaea archaeon]